ncbi:MAG: ribonuclease P protein component [Woeseiaceae bacterium]
MKDASLVFRRHQRLLTGADFKHVFQNSQRSKDSLFMVCAHFHQRNQARLGLAISKRHARLAVQRNRLKRHARETFRRMQHELPKADFVIVNHPAATSASDDHIIASLQQHFQRLSVPRGRRRTGPTTTKH